MPGKLTLWAVYGGPAGPDARSARSVANIRAGAVPEIGEDFTDGVARAGRQRRGWCLGSTGCDQGDGRNCRARHPVVVSGADRDGTETRANQFRRFHAMIKSTLGSPTHQTEVNDARQASLRCQDVGGTEVPWNPSATAEERVGPEIPTRRCRVDSVDPSGGRQRCAATSASCSQRRTLGGAGPPTWGRWPRKAVMKSARSHGSRCDELGAERVLTRNPAALITANEPPQRAPQPPRSWAGALDAQHVRVATYAQSEGSRWPSQCQGYFWRNLT